MATPPNHEPTSATRQSPEKHFNWGWVALGGCLGLVIVTSPVILMVLGMAIHSIREDQESDRRQAEATASAPPRPPTPSPPELICDPVAPAVVARIEARLTIPGTTLRGAQAVRSAANPQLWVVAADLEGVGRYAGDDDIGVWTVRWDRATPSRKPEAPASVAAVNGLAARAGPFPRSDAERRSVEAAVTCADEALARG